MNKILVIGGPTATGKTSLALKLAQKFNGDLISADSRQVYQGLDLVTGKDIPAGFSPSPYQGEGRGEVVYTDGTTNIYGLDLVKPSEEFSVVAFQVFAFEKIKQIHQKKRLPIIVGGTGLYLKSLLEPFSPPSGPPDHLFRDKLAKLPLIDLQVRLQKTDPERFEELNHSDLNNPRRLIRALEINFYSRFPSSPPKLGGDKRGGIKDEGFDSLALCLIAPIKTLETKIKQRVKDRLSQDLIPELEYVKTFGKTPAYTSLGYKELNRYYQKKITKSGLITLWSTHERQYAKRQLTWFKKQKNFQFYDITKPKYAKEIETLVKNWYIGK